MRVEQLQGKFRMSSDKSQGDREGIVRGFQGLGTEVRDGMARMVLEGGALKDLRR